MDISIIISFGVLALALSFLYLYKEYLPAAAISGILFIFLGLLVAGVGSVDQTDCFNQITLENYTYSNETLGTIDYITNTNEVTCNVESLSIDENYQTAFGMILILFGLGVFLTMHETKKVAKATDFKRARANV